MNETYPKKDEMERISMKKVHLFGLFLLIFFFTTGFSLDNAIVPQDQILSGGPPKDGIPALLEPKFISAGEAAFISAKDQVIGVVISGRPRAYPIRILNWHEVVNDVVADTPLSVTF